MIGAAELERAETTLAVVYGGDIGRALEDLRVDRAAWDNFLAMNRDIVSSRYREAYAKMDPRLEPAFNTIMTHCLFVGLVAGRNSIRSME